MKVSIERSALLKAMSQAQSVVERRNTIPILANVLIEAEGGEISFRATDLDIEVVYKVVGMVERAGATTVGAHTLHEIVRKLPDGAMVELTDDATANRLDVVAGRSSFSLSYSSLVKIFQSWPIQSMHVIFLRRRKHLDDYLINQNLLFLLKKHVII
jgi:DNA polymerase-3 subunit beta